MGKYFICAVIFILTAVAVSAQPKLTLKEKELNFGELSASGEAISKNLSFRNDGDKPLVITNAAVNCNCTKIVYPKKPIPSGAEGVIQITYDPHKQSGTFYKAINVYTNAEQQRTIITIKGNVTDKKKLRP